MSVPSENIRLGVARLQRHYDSCLANSDEISLLDLAHTLRVWVDMQDEVQAYLRSLPLTPKFKKYALSKRSPKIISIRYPHIIVCFPDEVVLKGMHMAHFSSIGRVLTSEELSHLNTREGEFIYSKTDFKDWLGAEAVRINFLNSNNVLERQIMPRHAIITRVANTLGASHPVGMPTDNLYNEAVKHLLTHQFGGQVEKRGLQISGVKEGFTLPYLILMKIAQDILRAFK